MDTDDDVGATSFHDMGLDDRILKAVASLGWSTPTPIQEKGIPLVLEGRDVLARAKTGSGKTAAYAIPMIQKILERKDSDDSHPPGVIALVLVPSKELSNQATKNIKELCSCCSREVKVVNVSSSSSSRNILLDQPSVIVGTPSKALSLLQTRKLSLRNSLQVLVVDEADLVFSYGYEEDFRSVINHLPSTYQAVLTSATLSEDVLSLKKLVLHNPVTLKLEESDIGSETRLTQYHIKCLEDEKFLLIYTLLKLNLVRGKTLLFVNDIDRCYKLKLFLERFFIKCCILNSELPHNSRCHVVEEFNRGIYDYIIATDESSQLSADSEKKKRTGLKRKRDKEYGVARGIDFQGVENVVNFDFPPSCDAYVHRVGRTARGNDYGSALTFVCAGEEENLQALQERLIATGQSGSGDSQDPVQPYRFKMSEIDGFRYRVMDALRSITHVAIRKARLREIRSEMLNSEKLKSFFEDNPREVHLLRHDKDLQPDRRQSHLKDVPSYLMPKVMRDKLTATSGTKGTTLKYKKFHNRKPNKKKNDPLKSFKVTATGYKTSGKRPKVGPE